MDDFHGHSNTPVAGETVNKLNSKDDLSNAVETHALSDCTIHKNDLSSVISAIGECQLEDKTKGEDISSLSNIPVDEVSEAGRFSLATLCALSLNNLFPESWNTEFNTKCISNIVLHLQLPQRVECMLKELIKDNLVHCSEPYVALLREEPCFASSCNLEPLVHHLVTIAVHDGSYDARWRVLIHYVSRLLDVNPKNVDKYESTLVNCLLHRIIEQTEDEKKDEKTRSIVKRVKRAALISLAAAGGGAVIGMTGGLAAPLIGAGLTSFLGASAVFSAVSSTAGAAVVGSLFGFAGGGLTGYKMHRRVGDIEEFEFHELNAIVTPEPISSSSDDENKGVIRPARELYVLIAISGWIKDKSDDNYTRPWIHLCGSKEQYYLRYESSYLLELGCAMNYVASFVMSAATQETLKYTVLSGLVSAIAWPAGLIGLASVIDNPWGVCLRRSAQVGKQLAETLLAREHGSRPVTLVGYSLGARVIFYCLREMSMRKNCGGIIQDAILIGAPCTGNVEDWSKFGRVVSGRIVNCYCGRDWLLKFLYRTLSVAVDGVTGLQPINWKDRRMYNVDVSDLVTGHSDYPEKMKDILTRVDLATTDIPAISTAAFVTNS